jgi:hypothetical protein
VELAQTDHYHVICSGKQNRQNIHRSRYTPTIRSYENEAILSVVQQCVQISCQYAVVAAGVRHRTSLVHSHMYEFPYEFPASTWLSQVYDTIQRWYIYVRTSFPQGRGHHVCTKPYIPTKSICRLFFRTTHVNWRRSYYGLGNIVRFDRLAKSPNCKYARYSAQSCVRLRPPFGLCVMQSFANDVKKH